MGKVLNDQPIVPGEGILHHSEGVDLMPSDIQLSGMKVSLVNAMSRETILRQYLDTVRKQYTHILLDCQPSLGMLTVNTLAAANRLIVSVQAEYASLNKIYSNIQQIARHQRAAELDADTVAKMCFLMDNVCFYFPIYYLSPVLRCKYNMVLTSVLRMF